RVPLSHQPALFVGIQAQACRCESVAPQPAQLARHRRFDEFSRGTGRTPRTWDAAVLFADMPNLSRVCAVEKLLEGWDLSTDRIKVRHAIARARKAFKTRLEKTLMGKEKDFGLNFADTGPKPPRDAEKQGRTGWDVSAVRPARRVGPDGQLLTDLIVELSQARWVEAPVPGGLGGFWFRGGCTLVFDLESGHARYCIRKDINSTAREERQMRFLTTGAVSSLQATYFGALEAGGEPFAFLHGEPDGAQELP
ncbi:MAG TPA: hypothetical protein VIB55_13730, partial [Longimicrobium sp.]